MGPTITLKHGLKPGFQGLLFVLHSLSAMPIPLLQHTQKCKLLLHLGNSRAFHVDFRMGLAYDLRTGFFLTRRANTSLPASRLWFKNGHSAKEHVCVRFFRGRGRRG